MVNHPNRNKKDRVFETQDGWCCIVNGKTFGTWRSKSEAKGGMQTEQERAKDRSGLDQHEYDHLDDSGYFHMT